MGVMRRRAAARLVSILQSILARWLSTVGEPSMHRLTVDIFIVGAGVYLEPLPPSGNAQIVTVFFDRKNVTK